MIFLSHCFLVFYMFYGEHVLILQSENMEESLKV